MTEDFDDEKEQEEEIELPSDEEAERQLFEKLDFLRTDPIAGRYVVRADRSWEKFNERIQDLFVRSPHTIEDSRFSNALIMWTGMEGKPAYLNEWWAPTRLVSPEALAEADYYSQIHPHLVAGGVAGGAALAKVFIGYFPAEDEARLYLGLPEGTRTTEVWTEYLDAKKEPVLVQRQILIAGYGIGHFRNVEWELETGSEAW